MNSNASQNHRHQEAVASARAAAASAVQQQYQHKKKIAKHNVGDAAENLRRPRTVVSECTLLRKKSLATALTPFLRTAGYSSSSPSLLLPLLLAGTGAMYSSGHIISGAACE